MDIHEQLYFTNYEKQEISDTFHHCNLFSLALIRAHAIYPNLLIFFSKFQAQKWKSYIRDTKDFIKKLSSIKNIHENSFLGIVHVSYLYTNINH